MFQTNRLIYVYLRNGKNIIAETTLYRNIADLRFMYIECYVDRSYQITLDVTREFPAMLLVFEVHVKHRDKTALRRRGQRSLFGAMDGPTDRVSFIREQLIHSMDTAEEEQDEDEDYYGGRCECEAPGRCDLPKM